MPAGTEATLRAKKPAMRPTTTPLKVEPRTIVIASGATSGTWSGAASPSSRPRTAPATIPTTGLFMEPP